MEPAVNTMNFITLLAIRIQNSNKYLFICFKIASSLRHVPEVSNFIKSFSMLLYNAHCSNAFKL